MSTCFEFSTYLGHSTFAIRASDDNTTSNVKYVSNIQVTSDECDNEILNGLPTTDTFEIGGDSYFVECLYGDDDLCQVYMQYTQTINVKNFTRNNETKRRLQVGRFCDEDDFDIWSWERHDVYPYTYEYNCKRGDKLYMGTLFTYNGYNVKCCASYPYILELQHCSHNYYYCRKITVTPTPPSPIPVAPAPRPSPCFPEGTMVNTTYGIKLIEDLNISDKVLAVNEYTGKLEYSDVYMHGHKMNEVVSEFVTLYTSNDDLTISASWDHFIYVCDYDDCNWDNAILKRVGKVAVNKDFIFDYNMDKYLVVRKEMEIKQGLYNPYTLNGNIVVNNVIASCHSEWILDDLVPDNYESYLPAIYQFILTPVRYIYAYIPNSWLTFNTLYPDGLCDICNVNMFEFMKQVLWSLISKST